jgi:glycosyltransferase involved in cell wall biosynthesis
MKVLYVDAVGPFGGASRSLFEAVQALSAGPVRAYFVMQRGTAQDFYGKVAQDVIAVRGLTRFDNTRVSHYHGVRWLVPLREIFHFPYTLAAMWQAKRRWGEVDLIHVNEVIDIIPGLLAKALFKAPMVVHVRSLQWTNQRALRTRWVNARLRRSAAAVIAINENTRASLPQDLPVDVIQNSFTPKKAANPDPALLARLATLRPGSLKVGFVGNLHAAKGLFDLLEAVRILRSQGHDVECLVVGGVTIPDRGLKASLLARAGLAQNVEAEVHAKVREYDIGDSFHLLGHTNDIQTVYEKLDVIAFPSYFDAPGRPVFEAAFSGVPSIVCVEKPRPDTLVPGETGLTVPPMDPPALAHAILHFALDRAEVRRMGANARALAVENFVPATNAQKLLAVYERVLAASARPRAR